MMLSYARQLAMPMQLDAGWQCMPDDYELVQQAS